MMKSGGESSGNADKDTPEDSKTKTVEKQGDSSDQVPNSDKKNKVDSDEKLDKFGNNLLNNSNRSRDDKNGDRTETSMNEQESEISFQQKQSKKGFCKWCKSKIEDKKRTFKKKSLTFQVCSCLVLFLSMVCIFLCVILIIGVFFMMNLTYEKIYTSNLENLSREIMGEMDVFKNMSHRFIEKDEWLMTGVLDAETVDNYPLDWTQLDSGI